jgi:hypothetical protein
LAIFVVEYLSEYESVCETALANESVDPRVFFDEKPEVEKLVQVPLNDIISDQPLMKFSCFLLLCFQLIPMRIQHRMICNLQYFKRQNCQCPYSMYFIRDYIKLQIVEHFHVPFCLQSNLSCRKKEIKFISLHATVYAVISNITCYGTFQLYKKLENTIQLCN